MKAIVLMLNDYPHSVVLDRRHLRAARAAADRRAQALMDAQIGLKRVIYVHEEDAEVYRPRKRKRVSAPRVRRSS